MQHDMLICTPNEIENRFLVQYKDFKNVAENAKNC
jgi:hypothetical protein